MVVSAAVAAIEPSSSIYAVTVDHHDLMRIGHVHATDVFVVVHDARPTAAVGALPARPHLGESAVRIGVWRIGQVFLKSIVSRHILKTGRNAVVHIGIKVVSLVQTCPTHIRCQNHSHGSMSLVSVGFLHLSEITEGSTLVRMELPYQIAKRLGIAVVLHVLVILHTGIVHINVVAQNAHTDFAQHVAQPPIRPVMIVCTTMTLL